MKQSEMISIFNDKCRPKFNADLFNRKDIDTIEQIKNVILSCQRDKFFTIKVKNFRVVESYQEILDLLRKYEEGIYKKNKKKENQYDYIDLKASDILLLVVTYYIKLGDEEETLDVLITVPRLVDKFYFRINGNIFSAMYQIVDASTYNNSTSNAKRSSVTLKTMFMPIRVYRYYENMKTINKDTIQSTLFVSRIFNKSLPLLKYILAKYGLIGAMDFLNLGSSVLISDKYVDDLENYYVFEKNGIYISTPKCIFDKDDVVQSFVRTVYKSIIKDTNINNIRTNEFWLKSLGLEFNNLTVEKGLSILDSLESIYDKSTRESIHLPIDKKKDIYAILRWMIGDFQALKMKNNLDISTKKIRYSEYIASLYAMKLSTGIYRVSDLGKKAKLEAIKKAICINPNYLISAISRCKLVTYKNLVNDLDALTEIKFTYKGIAGIGEKSNSIPEIYRHLDVSHLGRLDPDSSSNSDPGVTGAICPLAPLYDMHFSEFEEPNYWESEFQKTVDNYRKLKGLKQCILVKKDLLNSAIDEQEIEFINDNLEASKRLIQPIVNISSDEYINGIDIFGNGVMFIEYM